MIATTTGNQRVNVLFFGDALRAKKDMFDGL
jgi:hypothetical protein